MLITKGPYQRPHETRTHWCRGIQPKPVGPFLEKEGSALLRSEGQGELPEVTARSHEPELVVSLPQASQAEPREAPAAPDATEDGLDSDGAPLPESRPALDARRLEGPRVFPF